MMDSLSISRFFCTLFYTFLYAHPFIKARWEKGQRKLVGIRLADQSMQHIEPDAMLLACLTATWQLMDC